MADNTEILLQQILVKLDELRTEIKEDVNDLKTQQKVLEEKINGVDTRLKNEETISRTALGAIAGVTVLAVAKYLFFADR